MNQYLQITIQSIVNTQRSTNNRPQNKTIVLSGRFRVITDNAAVIFSWATVTIITFHAHNNND